MKFTEAIIEVLKANNNTPMTSNDILIEIFKMKLPLNSSGSTPERTLNTILNRHAINSTATKVSKNKYFRILTHGISNLPNRYVLLNTKTNIYLTVKLEVQSYEPLTQEQLDKIVSDVDYDFDYHEKGVNIVSTEITDSEIK